MQFVVQAGMMTADDFEFKPTWATASIQLAVHLNEFIVVAPECSIFIPDLKFKPSFFWAPGATINYIFGDLFFGAGPFRWVEASDTSEEPIREWQVKGQVGFIKSSLCITIFAFMHTDSLFKDMKVGLQAGIVL